MGRAILCNKARLAIALVLLFAQSPFAITNLLTNGDASYGNTSGWSTAVIGDPWVVSGGNFVSSYSCAGSDSCPSWNRMYQEVNLLALGYSESFLDSAPTLQANGSVIGIPNIADYDMYGFKVELRNASRSAIASNDTGLLKAYNTSWVTYNKTFSGYGSGLRYICFEQYGYDRGYWEGNYGPAFDRATAYFDTGNYLNSTFVSQLPADFNSTNALSNPLNITYNITGNATANNSTVYLYYKTNSTSKDCTFYLNGSDDCGSYSGSFGGNFSRRNYTNASGTLYMFQVYDNQVYPASYNLDERTMELTEHNSTTLSNPNHYIKVRLFNVSNSTPYNFFEIMANNSGPQPIGIYYCNESYSAGNPAGSAYCALIDEIPGGASFDHWHSAYSGHHVVPFAMNTTTGLIGNVKVTPISYFLVRGRPGSSAVSVFYAPNVSRPDTVQYTSNSGSSWSNQSYTIDAHIHQYMGNDTLHYYVCANSTENSEFCSELVSDLANLTSLPPTPPVIASPNESTYNYTGTINITYAAAVSPNNYSITHYNISLLDANYSFNQTIAANNSLNLSYLWNASALPYGTYAIRVMAFDSIGQNASGYAEFRLLHCGTITTANDSLVLLGDLAANGTACFTISAENATLDCNGYAITGNNSSNTIGIIANHDNATIANCRIYEFDIGILLNQSNGSSITNTTINLSIGDDHSSALHATGVLIRAAANTNTSGLRSIADSVGWTTESGSTFNILEYGNITAHEIGVFVQQGSYNQTIRHTYSEMASEGAGFKAAYYSEATSRNTTINNCTFYANSSGGIALHNEIACGLRVFNTSAYSEQFEGTTIGGCNPNQAGGFNETTPNYFYNLTTYGGTDGFKIYNEDNLTVVGSSINGTLIGVDVYASSNNMSLENSTIESSGTGVHINAGGYTVFKNNTFLNATNLVYLDSSSGNNTFCWNNFTEATGYYVDDGNGSNSFNSSLCGGEGNIWANVLNESVQVYGGGSSSYGGGLYYGTYGTGYPYNNTTAAGKLSGNVVDYAPLTRSLSSPVPTINSPSSGQEFLFNSSSSIPVNVTAAGANLSPTYLSITLTGASNSTYLYNSSNGSNTANCTASSPSLFCYLPLQLNNSNYTLTAFTSDNLSQNGTATLNFSVSSTLGNSTNITAGNLSSPQIKINGTNVSSITNFTGVLLVNITDSGSDVLAFNYNFSLAGLNISAISITNGTLSGASFIEAHGIGAGMVGGKNATLYGASTSYSQICVLDTEGALASSISSTCAAADETLLTCNGTPSNGKWCNQSGATISIFNLTHSAAIQFSPPSSSSGSSGGGLSTPSLSYSFNCSTGALSIKAAKYGSPISNLEIRLKDPSKTGYLATAATSPEGAASFTIAQSQRYSAESAPTPSLYQAYLDAFQLTLCPPLPEQPVQPALPDGTAQPQPASTPLPITSNESSPASESLGQNAANYTNAVQALIEPEFLEEASALEAISRAKSALAKASAEGKDITLPASTLMSAKAALKTGNFTEASRLAALSAKQSANSSVPLPSESSKPLRTEDSAFPIAAISALALALLLAAVLYILYRRRNGRRNGA